MKRITLFFAVFCFLTAFKCNKKDDANCANIACTTSFAMITVEVVDNNGNAVKLDDYYTLTTGSNGLIKPDQGLLDTGTYVVLDDSYQSQLKNRTDNYIFKGFINGKEVVSEQYTIGADCCHIYKKSGTGKVVVP